MRSLYLRIWLTVVSVLAAFALVSGWLVQRHVAQERERVESAAQGRAEAWGDLLQRSLPPADAPGEEQVAALREWSQRLRLPLALDDAAGRRIGASDSFLRREADAPPGARRGIAIRLDDGRTLWIARGPAMRRGGGPGGPGGPGGMDGPLPRPSDGVLQRLQLSLPGLPPGLGLVVLLAVLFLAVAGGAWPVVRHLTRRLEALKQGVEAFGAGALHQRVSEDGRDEVASLAAAFNRAAAQVQDLLRSNQNLLANASHELRSPLARLKMAVSLLDDASGAQRDNLRREIHRNIAELDALVEEVLLASRLDAGADVARFEQIDLARVAREEAERVQARVSLPADAPAAAFTLRGDERLLRRACRNLLENARRYGGEDVVVELGRSADAGAARVLLRVCDRGPGVPEAWRERIFEPFCRLPGHAEHEGGVGLGLSLVRQIARRHGGEARCEDRPGGGSCFSLQLPG